MYEMNQINMSLSKLWQTNRADKNRKSNKVVPKPFSKTPEA